ncbi:MAG: transglutaminase-like family protein [bacterium]|nr:transglutaminase-like family protein [bacterium]
MMPRFSTKTCLILAAAALVAGLALWLGTLSVRTSTDPNEVAWALLAEADELCRKPIRPAASSELSTALAARLAVGAEALEIVRELAATIRDARSRASILEARGRSLRRCAGQEVAPLGRDQPQSSRVGSSPRQRRELVTAHLERLTEAASRAVENHREQLAPPADSWTATLASLPEAPQSGAAAAPGESTSEQSPDARADPEPERASIVIRAGSRKHRERVERWSAIFRREGGALRTSRRDLQFEIESYSLAGSRNACRAFGSVLAGIDSGFEQGAPSRGLSIRVARMLKHYRRGVTECVAGRPASAFGYLSEGDREWALVAQNAARMLEPRRLRVSALVQAKSLR